MNRENQDPNEASESRKSHKLIICSHRILDRQRRRYTMEFLASQNFECPVEQQYIRRHPFTQKIVATILNRNYILTF